MELTVFDYEELWGLGRTRLMLQALRAIWETGFAVAQEIREFLEDERSYAPGHRGVKRAVMVDLAEAGLAEKRVLPFIGPGSLALIRLTEDGRMQAQAFGRGGESAWERLIRMHRGEEWERHTVGLLAMAWQLRRRGMDVALVPDASLRGVEPDAEVSWDGGLHLYMEFEVRARGRVARWKRWGELVREGPLVCTFTEGAARAIAREIEQARVRGRVISLERMTQDEADKWEALMHRVS